MFGIGLPELAVIAFFGIVLFGPDKLPQLASQAAKAVRTAKNMADAKKRGWRRSKSTRRKKKKNPAADSESVIWTDIAAEAGPDPYLVSDEGTGRKKGGKCAVM